MLVIGFFFGVLPLFVMLDLQEVAWREVLVDRGMWISVACQFAGALTLLLNQLDWVRTVDDPRRFFKHQLGLLAVRWGAMILVGFFLSRFIPRPIYGWLLIVTYAVATAALELAPGPVLAMVARWIGAGDPPRGERPRMQEKSRTAVDPPSAKLETGRRPSWLLLLFGAAFAVFGGIGIWSEADVSLRGVRATAKVIEVQGGIGKTKSVAANVEVGIPGQQRFRAEVHDTLGMETWTEGGSVEVVCAKLTTSFPNCELDSMLDRWLFPVLLFALGVAALWGALRRRGPESMAPKR